MVSRYSVVSESKDANLTISRMCWSYKFFLKEKGLETSLTCIAIIGDVSERIGIRYISDTDMGRRSTFTCFMVL